MWRALMADIAASGRNPAECIPFDDDRALEVLSMCWSEISASGDMPRKAAR
jgi:hypothetical protein